MGQKLSIPELAEKKSADDKMLMWSRAIASERGFQVEIFEPDVSPLAVQGPDAENVVAALC